MRPRQMMRMTLGGLALAALIALLAGAPVARAAIIEVTNTNDSGPGSLRQAIADASPGDTIVVPPDPYTLTSGPLLVNKSLTISGAGAATTILSASHLSRVLTLQAAGNVTVSGVTVTDGEELQPQGTAQGGGISADGGTDLTLTDVAVTGNVADASGTSGHGGGIAEGGGIYHAGDLSITNSVVSGNQALARGATGQAGGIAQGGGIFDNASPANSLAVTNVTLDSNSADASGDGASGGIAEGGSLESNNSTAPMILSSVTISRSVSRSDASGPGGAGIADGAGIEARSPATLTNVTVSENSGDASATGTGQGGSADGGGVMARASMTLRSDTISANTVTAAGSPPGSASGGDLARDLSTVTIENSIVASGTGQTGYENCSAAFGSNGHNIDSLDQCGFHSAGDLVDTDPRLGPLDNNGGPTETQALLSASPAIDAGGSADCPLTDERGVARPSGACDIGAYQIAPPTVTTGAATGASQTRAALGGSVIPNLRESTYYFEYGTTASYGLRTATAYAGAGSSSVSVSANLAGLEPGTTYHYALVAANADGTSVGADRTVTTLAAAVLSTPQGPLLSRLRVNPQTFHAAPRGSSVNGPTRVRHRTFGTVVHFQLDAPASVRFTVQAARTGRRAANGRCAAPTRRNRRLRRCIRVVNLPGSFTVRGRAGANTSRFTGRLAGKTLTPGGYRLVATATAGAVAGHSVRRSFRIVP